ncbi:MAG: ATP-binding protein [Dialister invisus]|jgi:hypothetical protein|uniref:ATP-binding protein n=1 Tax=Dialister invisus TaxID=218538 RepID=A0A930FNY0_9FIRM|nr:ATP-binding protein [Dialister invisus]
MKIDSMKISNFRGYAENTEIKFNDLTVFVGKNDIGKSTVLEALDIFFNEGKGVVKLDKSDVNVENRRNENQETCISVIFKDLPDEIVIDSNVRTTLKDEFLLNEDSKLEVIKKYNNGGYPKVFIKARHPSNSNCKDLLLKKNADLKKIVQQKQIVCENQSVNSLLRKAIWEHYSEDLSLQETEIDASKEDAKKIWDKLSNYMPVYSLFQSDRKNSDGDSEVQDPLKEAVKQIINDEELQQTLASVAKVVETKLKEVSGRTLEKLREMDPAVANSLNPVIPTADKLKWVDVFKAVSISGDEDIPINKRGSGVKRLVLLNFFRAEAERRAEEGDNTGIIYAIEEPETSQHTENQKKLIEAFKSLSQANNVQVLLTTHSAFIVKHLDFTDIRLITQGDGSNQRVIKDVLPRQLKYPSLNEVNFIAFNEATEEYHDELYGFIDFQGWREEYKRGKPLRPYKQIGRNRKIINTEKILTEYIRHQIHHPENTHNNKYTEEELLHSINMMREFISRKQTEENVNPE